MIGVVPFLVWQPHWDFTPITKTGGTKYLDRLIFLDETTIWLKHLSGAIALE